MSNEIQHTPEIPEKFKGQTLELGWDAGKPYINFVERSSKSIFSYQFAKLLIGGGNTISSDDSINATKVICERFNSTPSLLKENQELKVSFTSSELACERMRKERDELKAENERLKKEIQELLDCGEGG